MYIYIYICLWVFMKLWEYTVSALCENSRLVEWLYFAQAYQKLQSAVADADFTKSYKLI